MCRQLIRMSSSEGGGIYAWNMIIIIFSEPCPCLVVSSCPPPRAWVWSHAEPSSTARASRSLPSTPPDSTRWIYIQIEITGNKVSITNKRNNRPCFRRHIYLVFLLIFQCIALRVWDGRSKSPQFLSCFSVKNLYAFHLCLIVRVNYGLKLE